MRYTTTSELVQASKDIMYRAKKVKTILDYNLAESDNDIVLNEINNALETGYFQGIARQELLQARTLLLNASYIAQHRVNEL